MNLSPDDMALAEACGVTFLPATAAQVQRLSMQRKVFYAANQPMLATRGDGLFETAGTLQHLIEEAARQRGDLLAWQDGAAPQPDPATASVPPQQDAPPADTPLPDERAAPVALQASSRTARRATRRPSPQHRSGIPTAPADPTQDSALLQATAAATDGAKGKLPQRAERWRVAGAERRGRAAKHWTTRHRS